MSEVVQLSSAADVELMRRLGITKEELRANIRNVFLWMYDKGITDLSINRTDAEDTKPVVTINGARVELAGKGA